MVATKYTDDIHVQMGETACVTRVKYRDYFHLKNLYRYMHEWLWNDGWGYREYHKWPERLYMSNQRADGEEKLIWWRMMRDTSNDNRGFYRKYMDIDFHVLYLKTVETVINGSKVKANWGQIDITIRGRLVGDPDHEWKKHWFLKHIQNYYWNVINNDIVEQQREELYQDCYKFHDAIKAFFNLYYTTPAKKPFRSIAGMETGKYEEK